MSAGSMAGEMKKRNWPRWGLAIIGILLLVGLGYYGYGRFFATQKSAAPVSPPAVAAAVSVKTATVAAGPIAASLTYSADVRSASQVSVVPKASGRIEALSVDVGSRVKQGRRDRPAGLGLPCRRRSARPGQRGRGQGPRGHARPRGRAPSR